jgi:hypothetical protein
VNSIRRSLVVRDVPSLQRFISDEPSKILGVANIRSSFALKQARYRTALPLPQPPMRESRLRGLGELVHLVNRVFAAMALCCRGRGNRDRAAGR